MVVDQQVLLSAAVRGDLRSFEYLVRRHTPAVYRYCARMLPNRADAEDCTQETWLAAWRALPGFREDASLTTWLYRIATNQALMMLRRRRVDMPVGELPEVSDDGAGDPARQLQKHAEREAVRKAIRQLPVQYRVPLVLREFESLRYDEIAGVLDLGVPAVKTRLHRGRAQLLSLLGGAARDDSEDS